VLRTNILTVAIAIPLVGRSTHNTRGRHAGKSRKGWKFLEKQERVERVAKGGNFSAFPFGLSQNVVNMERYNYDRDVDSGE
jgi:hypothetical protein